MNEEIYHVKAKLHVDTSELDAAEAKVDLLTEKLKGVADLIADLTSTDITVIADVVPDEKDAEGTDSLEEYLTDVMLGKTEACNGERHVAALELCRLLKMKELR